jgi:hypothetical protein
MRPLTRWTTLWRSPVAPVHLVLAFVLVGTAACGPQQTDLAVATEAVDEWIAAWNAHDPDAIGGAFTADAVYQDLSDQWSGRDSIRDHARYFKNIIREVRRIGEGRATERGTFVFRLGFDFDFGSGPGTDVGEVEVTITDRLMSRVEWLNREQVG